MAALNYAEYPCYEITSPVGWAPMENRNNNIWKKNIDRYLSRLLKYSAHNISLFNSPFLCAYLQMSFSHDLYSPKSFVHLFSPTFRGREKTKFSIPKLSKTKSRLSLTSICCYFISRETKPQFKNRGLIESFHTDLTSVYFSYTIF